MATFLFRRTISLLVVLFCVITLTFFLVRMAPGGPFSRERKLPPAIEKQLLARYKLDGTLWQQSVSHSGRISAPARLQMSLPETDSASY